MRICEDLGNLKSRYFITKTVLYPVNFNTSHFYLFLLWFRGQRRSQPVKLLSKYYSLLSGIFPRAAFYRTSADCVIWSWECQHQLVINYGTVRSAPGFFMSSPASMLLEGWRLVKWALLKSSIYRFKSCWMEPVESSEDFLILSTGANLNSFLETPPLFNYYIILSINIQILSRSIISILEVQRSRVRI